jgi:hemoglobin
MNSGTQTTIYDKYGGYDFFHKCIYGLYLEMFDHPEISYHFIGVDIERLSKHQTQFLVRAIGGPVLYEGGPIKEVHALKNISEYEFAEIAKAFRDVFLKHGVQEADVYFIMNFVASFKPQIVTCKVSKMDLFMIPIYRFFKRIVKFLK